MYVAIGMDDSDANIDSSSNYNSMTFLCNESDYDMHEHSSQLQQIDDSDNDDDETHTYLLSDNEVEETVLVRQLTTTYVLFACSHFVFFISN